MPKRPARKPHPADRVTTDSQTVELLAMKLGTIICDHYRAGPPSRLKVYEVMNALAGCAAMAIKGGGDDAPALYNWFINAIKLNFPSNEIDLGDIASTRAVETIISLKTTMKGLLVEIDQELEQRQHSGNAEDFAGLQSLSDNAHKLLSDLR